MVGYIGFSVFMVLISNVILELNDVNGDLVVVESNIFNIIDMVLKLLKILL